MDRASLHRALELTLERSLPQGTAFAVVLFDIDRFKLINCGFGDTHGDLVLKEVATVARTELRVTDHLARWGGQQFLAVLPETDAVTATALAERLRLAIEQHVVAHGLQTLHVTASFGVACFPKDGRFARRLLAGTEAALYQAKDLGRNRIVSAGALQQRIFGVGNLLDKALRENRIVPAFQPIVDLNTGAIVAEESLARLITPEGRCVEAARFIGVSQQLQLTYKIDRAIIGKTFERCVESRGQGPARTHFVNISGNLLRHPDVLAEIYDMVSTYCEGCQRTDGVQPMVIEITEREFLGDIRLARETLQPFVDLGVQLALDDFGSGYATFLCLADLPFSYLKIEGSLIARITEPKIRAIVRGIQNISADLGLISLAEGIESAEVAQIVRDIGINWGQGYYFDSLADTEKGASRLIAS